MSDVTYLTVYHDTKCEDDVLCDLTKNLPDPDLVQVKRIGFTHFSVAIYGLDLYDFSKRLEQIIYSDPNYAIRVNYGKYVGHFIQDILVEDLIHIYGDN